MLDDGTILAGYRIDGVLGQGGMGVVYEATQLSLDRTVALKLLAAHLSDDIEFRERFRREGHIQAAIDHPNIITVYEAGESDHGLFLAMRLVRGPTLRELIQSGELHPERTIRILRPVADALETAHDADLIHRDVKPQNILVGPRGHPYLADFGLTKGPTEKSLTRTGQFVGTLDYISPEQIQGKRATARSDIYSLTAVLYECLTGTVPFQAESEAALLYAHISKPPPRVTETMPELPAGLDDTIRRGMAKNPDERHASALALIDEAQGALSQQPVRPPAAYATTRKEAAAADERPLMPVGETVAAAGETSADEAARLTRADSQPPPPAPVAPAPAGRQLWPVAVLVLLLVAALAAGLVLTLGGNESKAKAVEYEASTDPGKDPFTDPTDVRGAQTVAVRPSATGRFGSSRSDLVCDRELLIRSLRRQPERLRAWARVLEVGQDASAVASYVRRLHPVTLTRDTRVTSHSFTGGDAVPYQAIVAAGTAVLAEGDGRPAVRCRSGSPLLDEVFVAEAKCAKCPPNYRPARPCRHYGDCYQEYPSPPAVAHR